MRNLVLVFGDQLNRNSRGLEDFDVSRDLVWMAEVPEEATTIWSHKLRICFFLSAMRHFRDELRERGFPVCYHAMSEDPREDHAEDLASALARDIPRFQPEKVITVTPGDYRILESLQKQMLEMGAPLEFRPDRHFYCSRGTFEEFAAGRKRLVLESFYRFMRKSQRVLLREDGSPEGDQWNFDRENRKSFGKTGPGSVPVLPRCEPDETTREVLRLVSRRFGGHPGHLDSFDLPVTRSQAKGRLRAFIEELLPLFGPYEDAMWSQQPFLFHSRLSASLNVKHLDPRECVEAAVDAWREGRAPLNSVEGFVRQILGWREYVRGLYWLHMPGYARLNVLHHQRGIPGFFWDGETDIQCVRQTMAHVLRHGYSHHIHRLMVMGLFALLAGVHPYRFHEWHMAMYTDAIDWVSLPNALGMSQYADGGIVGTKPYCASGQYINRMSDFCRGCPYDPRKGSGADACPYTALYWHFLDRHHGHFKDNQRMQLQTRNLEKKRRSTSEMAAIRRRAEAVLSSL